MTDEYEMTPADLNTKPSCECGPYRRDELLKCRYCDQLFCCDCAREKWDSPATPWLGEECVEQVACSKHLAMAYAREKNIIAGLAEERLRQLTKLEKLRKRYEAALRDISTREPREVVGESSALELTVYLRELGRHYARALGTTQGIAKATLALGEQFDGKEIE